MDTKTKIDKDTIDKEDIINAFQNLGFSVNDARVYLSLLSLGPEGPVKISEDTKVDRSRVYDSLRRLRKKGYIEEEPVKRGPKYKANNPTQIINTLRKEYRNKLDLTTFLEQTLQNYTPFHDEPFLVSIRGADAIFKEIKDLIEKTEKFLQLIITPDLSKNYEKFAKIVGYLADKKRENPNVKIEIALNLKEEDFQFMLKKLHDNDITVYLWEIGDVLPYGLYISENSYIFTTLDIGQLPEYTIALTIENARPEMMDGFRHLFEFNYVSYFKKGKMRQLKKPFSGSDEEASLEQAENREINSTR